MLSSGVQGSHVGGACAEGLQRLAALHGAGGAGLALRSSVASLTGPGQGSPSPACCAPSLGLLSAVIRRVKTQRAPAGRKCRSVPNSAARTMTCSATSLASSCTLPSSSAVSCRNGGRVIAALVWRRQPRPAPLQSGGSEGQCGGVVPVAPASHLQSLSMQQPLEVQN